jgi:hypothetical protein
MSEVMTIMVWFHQQQYRTLKDFSTKHVMLHLRSEFPTLPSYNRFVELQSAAAIAVAITTVSLGRRSFKKMLDSGASCYDTFIPDEMLILPIIVLCKAFLTSSPR